MRVCDNCGSSNPLVSVMKAFDGITTLNEINYPCEIDLCVNCRIKLTNQIKKNDTN